MPEKEVLQEKLKGSKILIATAIFLFLLKLIVGLFSHSVALLSLAVDSLADLGATLLGYFAIVHAARPADEKHPYGHGKFENFAALAQSLFLVFTGCFLIYMAIQKFLAGKAVIHVEVSIGVLLFTTVVSWFAAWRATKIATKTGSVVLRTDALHYSIDVWTNLGAVAALLLVKLTGLTILDTAVAIAVSLYILWESSKIAKFSFDVLTDHAMAKKDIERIRTIIRDHYPKVLECREIRTRHSGSTNFVHLTLVICGQITLKEGHEITEHIEGELAKAIPLLQVTIDLEPCTCKDPKVDCKFFAHQEFTTHLKEELDIWE